MLVKRSDRSGATLVESAIVLPVALLIVIGIIVLSTLVFRKQQLTHMAREGARWASVHGDDYVKTTGASPTTPADVYNVIRPGATGLDPTKLTCGVTWDQSQKPDRTVVEGSEVRSRSNTVTVTVTYIWDTGTLFGSYPLSGSSTSIMSY